MARRIDTRADRNRMAMPADSKNDPNGQERGNSGILFPKSYLPVFSLFSLCYLLLEKII